MRHRREDFPALRQAGDERETAYLDSAATSHRPQVVLDAERAFIEQDYAAVHRGSSGASARSTLLFEEARTVVADLVHAQPAQIMWTAGATDSLNQVAHSIALASQGLGGPSARRFALAPGDEILVGEDAHHANLVPWQVLAAVTGATLRPIPVDGQGGYSQAAAIALINRQTRLVALTHVSNVTGIVAPVAEITAAAHARGALVVLDACQSVPHRDVDLAALGVDFAAFSGHKMLGPTGIGVLYGREELVNALPPSRTGGAMITTVTVFDAGYLPAPHRFEAGTPPVSQAVGLAAAARYLQRVGLAHIAAWEDILVRQMAAGLDAIPGVRLIGPPPGAPRAGLVSFSVDGVHAHDVGQYLDDRGVTVRVGHHCAQPLHRSLGLTASTRASTYLYTTRDDVARFLDAVRGVRHYFGARS